MTNELIIKRIHLSFGNEEYDWLNSKSDHPMEEGYIFSRVFTAADAFTSFLRELQSALSASEEFISECEVRYDAAYFSEKSLVLMFSDERSGSNRLTLDSAEAAEGLMSVTILRQRGLTMDMAYLFLFLETDEKNISRSEVLIKNDPNSEASIF